MNASYIKGLYANSHIRHKNIYYSREGNLVKQYQNIYLLKVILGHCIVVNTHINVKGYHTSCINEVPYWDKKVLTNVSLLWQNPLSVACSIFVSFGIFCCVTKLIFFMPGTLTLIGIVVCVHFIFLILWLHLYK